MFLYLGVYPDYAAQIGLYMGVYPDQQVRVCSSERKTVVLFCQIWDRGEIGGEVFWAYMKARWC